MSGPPGRASEPALRVIVGVDGSATSDAAVAWANRYAAATGARMTLIAVWDMPRMYGGDFPLPPNFDPLAEASRVGKQARRLVTLPANRVDVQVVARGTARTVLVEAARDADLLVVGSRGHSSVADLLLGSVSAYCARHAPVPVVVVR